MLLQVNLNAIDNSNNAGDDGFYHDSLRLKL